MKVTLYSNDCPRCSILKLKLDDASVIYETEKDVDKMISLGMTEAPVLEVDGKRMLFAEAVKWVNEYAKDNK